ncbi:TonB-dependent receptor [uncultured Flavobacterium sp.]|uniref:SusC/RagA family TonB-linked outer membrane protein n=1 Tax=uncultured Flavobacterium sp. TaxID=165435 RepID=UPI00259A3B8B|nr:TonB-dependent receptor [uncultured Flavobacterium sp.]
MRKHILMKTELWRSIELSLVTAFLVLISTPTFAAGKTVINDFDSSRVDSDDQQLTITGKVISADDKLALPGVNVIIKGTKVGTTTDFDGNFSIKVPSSSSVLVFSFIGFRDQEISVAGKSVVNVTMVADAKTLDDVVVVAYGTTQKKISTGSIETVTSKAFTDRAITSPALALQGETPGLVVTRSSTRPGNENINFQIRGATSVNGGTPLIVIDGAPVLNNEAFFNMNSDDIKSVTVLKDASAVLYGSRAANGVILVTTKKGAQGVMKVDYTTNLRIGVPGITPPTPTMQQYGTVFLEAATQDGAQANYWGWGTKENLELMKSGYQGIYNTAAWGNLYLGQARRFDEMFGTSVSTQQNISVSGGSEKSMSRVSFNMAEDIGALKTAYDGRKQYNLRFNNDYQVTNWLKLETGVSYLNYKIVSPSTGLDNDAFSADPPLFPSRNPYGQWYANFNISGNKNGVAATVDGGKNTTKRDQLALNMAATFNLYSGLTFKLVGNYNKDFYNYQSYVITVPQYSWYGELAPEKVNPNSSIREQSNQITYQYYGGFLNYNKSFGKHNVTALAGITSELTENKNLYGYRLGFVDNGVYDLNMGAIDQKVENSGGAGHTGLYSYLASVGYDYENKYILKLSGRRDGSSRFAEGHKWSNFGGVEAGWVVTEESFIKNNNVLNFLKLRASYGEMGNQSSGIGAYDYLSSVTTNGTALFGVPPAQQGASYVNGLTSVDRTWERIGIATYGVDFRLFSNNLSGSFDYYTKRNNGMLINVKYPDVLGGTAPKSNSGTLDTKGWEVVLAYKNNIGKLKYNIAVNMGDSRNELTKMDGATTWNSGLVANRQGYPINSFFMYQTDGLFKNQQEVDDYYAKYGSGGLIPSGSDAAQRLRPGDTKRVDLDGNGYISDVGNGTTDKGDVKYMGDSAAHYNYGINLGAQYGKFDFSAFFQGTLEQNIQRGGLMAYPFVTVYSNQTSAYIDRTWTEENQDALYPRMTANVTRAAWNWKNNDFALQNNRYIRMKALIIGYTLSDIKIKEFRLNNVRLYFSGNDLFEFTSVKDGYDPEFGEATNTAYPFTRTYSLGLNVSF